MFSASILILILSIEKKEQKGIEQKRHFISFKEKFQRFVMSKMEGRFLGPYRNIYIKFLLKQEAKMLRENHLLCSITRPRLK